MTVAVGKTSYTRQQSFAQVSRIYNNEKILHIFPFNQTGDCTKIDRSDPSFKATVADTEDLLSYKQFIELFLPFLVPCLVSFKDEFNLRYHLGGTIPGSTSLSSPLLYHLSRYALAQTRFALYLGNAIGTFGGEQHKRFECIILDQAAVCKIIISRVVEPSELLSLES